MKRTRATTPKTKGASGAAFLAAMTGLQALGVKKLTELLQRRRQQQETRSRIQRVASGRTGGLLLAAAGVGGAYYLSRGGRMSSALDQVKGRLGGSRKQRSVPDEGAVAPVQPPPPDPFINSTPPVVASPPSPDGPSS